MELWYVSGALLLIGTGTIIHKVSRWAGTIDANSSEITGFMKEIRADIKELLRRLAPSPLAGRSPLRLSDLGESISVELDAKTWASRVARKTKTHIDGMQPYEIHEFAFAYIRDEFEPSGEQDAKIRSCAYERALSRDKVLEVLAVELRDSLLELAGAPIPGSNQAA